jgi:hypothetical protein
MNSHASTGRDTSTAADALDDAIRTVGTSSGIDVGGTGTQRLPSGAPRPREIPCVRTFADVVVGVFDSDEPADRALEAFRRKGFRRDQIGLVMRTGALIVQEDALALADAADRGVPATLRELGVPEREALQYEREFESGRSIVTVKAAGRTRYAATLLQRATEAAATLSA